MCAQNELKYALIKPSIYAVMLSSMILPAGALFANIDKNAPARSPISGSSPVIENGVLYSSLSEKSSNAVRPASDNASSSAKTGIHPASGGLEPYHGMQTGQKGAIMVECWQEGVKVLSEKNLAGVSSGLLQQANQSVTFDDPARGGELSILSLETAFCVVRNKAE